MNFEETAITAKTWTVGAAKTSLLDVGYTRVGIDEGWENCSGTDPNHGLRQHDAAGLPMINTDKFPDFKALVDYGHSKGVLMGWYLNGCACGEREERLLNYQGDVKLLDEFGFDAVKLDGCGAATNMTYYAALMQATGKSYLIENCHWGDCTSGDDSSCPTADWCPFNWYRTSGDINASPMSWYDSGRIGFGRPSSGENFSAPCDQRRRQRPSSCGAPAARCFDGSSGRSDASADTTAASSPLAMAASSAARSSPAA